MKNQALKDMIVLVVILVVLFIICQFLPQEIPFHINAGGVADMTANKYVLLFGAVIPHLYTKARCCPLFSVSALLISRHIMLHFGLRYLNEV